MAGEALLLTPLLAVAAAGTGAAIILGPARQWARPLLTVDVERAARVEVEAPPTRAALARTEASTAHNETPDAAVDVAAAAAPSVAAAADGTVAAPNESASAAVTSNRSAVSFLHHLGAASSTGLHASSAAARRMSHVRPPPPTPSPPPPEPPPPPSPSPPPPRPPPTLNGVVNLDDLNGMAFYVHSLSAAQGQYYCYKVVVGTSIHQDYIGIGTPLQGWDNTACQAQFVGSYVSLGSLGTNNHLSQEYTGGDYSGGCATSDRKRKATLVIREEAGATTVTADVAEPSACTYEVTLKGPASAFIAPPHAPMAGEGNLRLVGACCRREPSPLFCTEGAVAARAPPCRPTPTLTRASPVDTFRWLDLVRGPRRDHAQRRVGHGLR